MRSQLFIALCFLAFTMTAQGQQLSLPSGYLDTQGNSTTSYPFNTLDEQRWQWHYDSSLFTNAGVSGPIVITELSVRLRIPGAPLASFFYASMTVTLGEASTGFQVSSHDPTFAANLSSNQKLVRSGPFSGPAQPAPGGAVGLVVPLELQESFVYDPLSGGGLIVEVVTCGGTDSFGSVLDLVIGQSNQVGGNRYGHLQDCTSPFSTFSNNVAVPIVIVDYTPALYQPNSTKASLDHNGFATDGVEPGTLYVNQGDLVNVNINTTLTGAPYDIAVALGAPIPGTDPGSITLAGGQMINLDFYNPGTLFLWGGTSPGLIPAASLSLPYGAPPAPFQYTAQSLYIDFTSPTLLALSSAASVGVRAPGVDVMVEAVGANSFTSPGMPPFWRITNSSATTRITEVTLDSSTSTAPNVSSMVFDTNQTSMDGSFNHGNSTILGCEGTYRQGTDALTGLVYDAENSLPGVSCDPLSNSGWIGSNGTVSASFKTLKFRYLGFDPGENFLFDCDTDGGAGITGAAMAGLVITIKTDNAGTITGTLVPHPTDPLASIFRFTN